MPVTPPKCSVCGQHHWLNQPHALTRQPVTDDPPLPILVNTSRARATNPIAKLDGVTIYADETPEQRKKRLTRERVARHRAKS